MSDIEQLGSFALFNNEHRKTEKHPRWTGPITINGEKYRLAAWLKENDKGKYIQGSITPDIKKDEGKPDSPAAAKGNDPFDDLDDDIPF
jgi:single-stranded DNA-binding protein